MHSKERVLTAVALEKADRLPLDFSANRWVTEKIKKSFGLDCHIDVLKYFASDIVDLRDVEHPEYIGPVPYRRILGVGLLRTFGAGELL